MPTFARQRREKTSQRLYGRWRRDKPQWLLKLIDEINYWMKASSRKRHGEPFNKRDAGFKRRQERRLKSIMRSEEGGMQ